MSTGDGSTAGSIPLSGSLPLLSASSVGDALASNIPLLIVLIFFVIAGAYFAGAESSFSAVNRIKIKSKADDGNRRAKGVMYILNRFEKALTTLLVGNNITHIAAASVATVLATKLFEHRGEAYIASFGFSMACTVVSTAIVFLFSEMIPKSLANDRSETVSMLANSSLRFFMKALAPITCIFGFISRAASRMFASEEQPSITEEELGEIFETAEEEGVVDEEQGDILKSVLEFSGTKIRDVMTMAKDVESISLTATEEEIITAIRDTNRSRIPVYSGTPENIVGTIRVRHYLIEYSRKRPVKLRQLLAAPYFISEDANVDDTLSDMRQHKHHMAIVQDDARKMVGLVTMEDLLEELVGEIFDEEDVVDRNFQPLGGNHYLVNTHMLMGSLYERMGLPKPPRGIVAKPLISFMLERTGRLLGETESFIYENLEFTVEAVEEDRPIEVDIHILDEETLAQRLAATQEEVAQ